MRTDCVHSLLMGILLCFTLVLTACKNEEQSNVPDYPVRIDIKVTLEDPGFVPESGFQTRTFTTKEREGQYIGYAGVLVWVNSQNQYRAADMACTKCVRRDIPVVVDGFYAVCPLCGEEYELESEGFPRNGIATQALKKYAVNPVNTFEGLVVQIRN